MGIRFNPTFKQTGGRVPHFRQIIVWGDRIAALAGDAGSDTGTVWVYIPESDYSAGAVGWVKLSRMELEHIVPDKSHA